MDAVEMSKVFSMTEQGKETSQEMFQSVMQMISAYNNSLETVMLRAPSKDD
jgi:hypothetical protein